MGRKQARTWNKPKTQNEKELSFFRFSNQRKKREKIPDCEEEEEDPVTRRRMGTGNRIGSAMTKSSPYTPPYNIYYQSIAPQPKPIPFSIPNSNFIHYY